MKKLLLFCLSILLVCFGLVSSTLAQDLDDLKIDNVICPTTVTAGTPLDVTVKVTNEGSTPITITRSAVVLSGNPVRFTWRNRSLGTISKKQNCEYSGLWI